MPGNDDGSIDAQKEAAMNKDINDANNFGKELRGDNEKLQQNTEESNKPKPLPLPKPGKPAPKPPPVSGPRLRLAGKIVIGLGVLLLIMVWGFSDGTATLATGETVIISPLPATFMALALIALPFIPRIIRVGSYLLAGLILFDAITINGSKGTEWTTENLTLPTVALILAIGLCGYFLPRLLMK